MAAAMSHHVAVLLYGTYVAILAHSTQMLWIEIESTRRRHIFAGRRLHVLAI
jgi:hypothetical protein